MATSTDGATTAAAPDSSSSATSPADPPLPPLSRPPLPPLARALLAGEHRELLAPLRFHEATGVPPPTVMPPDRRELARALEVANRAYGHPAAAELSRRLADPATRVVVTGQQPGVLGGPLLTLVKMAAASRWAEELNAAGEPAVAVFWVATEDHDWAEVGTVTLLDGDRVEELHLGDDPQPLAPLGVRTFGAGISPLLERLGSLGGERQEAWSRELARWYRPDARFGEAFCRAAVRQLGASTPLLLDAMLPTVKALSRPVLRRFVERRREVESCLDRADRRLEEAAFPLQVRPQPGVSPLFLLAGEERRRIAWEGADGYSLRGDGVISPVEGLRQILDDNPAIVSAGVLARPLVQDALLGTSLTLLGGSELSYYAQLAPLYELLEAPAPSVTLRPHTLVVDRRQQRWLEELGLPLAELLGPIEGARRRVVGEDARRAVARANQIARELLGELGPLATGIDSNLERPFAKTEQQILGTLERFGEKLEAAALARDEVASRRLGSLRSALLPLDRPQERVLSTAHFVGRYGDGFPLALHRQLDLSPGSITVVDPEGELE